MLSRAERIDGFHLRLSRTEKELYEEFLKTEEEALMLEIQQSEEDILPGPPMADCSGRKQSERGLLLERVKDYRLVTRRP